MDQFMYVADPARSLRVHNCTYLGLVRQVQWRGAHHVGATTAALSSWHGLRQSLRPAGSVR